MRGAEHLGKCMEFAPRLGPMEVTDTAGFKSLSHLALTSRTLSYM